MKKTSNKIINAWCMYDWANSAFATTIMAAVLPIYFRNVAAANLPEHLSHMATSLWGYTAAIAMLLVAVLSLILGPFSDAANTKKKFLALFMGIGVISTFLLPFTGPGDWMWVALLYICGCIGFGGSEVFYDSFLPHIAKPGELDRISSRGYALGYVGGGILLVVNVLMIWLLKTSVISPGQDPLPLWGMRLSLGSAALWWGFFSIPLLKHVPEPFINGQQSPGKKVVQVSLARLSETFKEIRKYKNLFLFLLAFWFYNDGIGTIIKMATAYGDEIGISTLDLVGALLLTQFIGIPMTLLFGKLADKIGAKKSILMGLGIYLVIVTGATFMTKATHFWILAAMVGLVQGGTQALSRSLFASLIPKNKSAEFFSFYNISGKFAGIAGPALFALAGQLTGTSRYGIGVMILFFVIGGILLMFVREE